MSVMKITNENFEELVLKNEKPVLLDFYAVWCGPCQMIAPFVQEIADENPQYAVGKIDVDEAPELAKAFGVTSIPTLVVMKDGNPVNKAVGGRSKEQILALFEE